MRKNKNTHLIFIILSALSKREYRSLFRMLFRFNRTPIYKINNLINSNNYAIHKKHSSGF